MTDPCSRTEEIAVLREQNKTRREENRAIRVTLEEITRTLGQIAEQSVEIRHLREDYHRAEKDINELFGRMRAVELAPGRSAGKVFWILITSASGTAGGIISALVVSLVRSQS